MWFSQFFLQYYTKPQKNKAPNSSRNLASKESFLIHSVLLFRQFYILFRLLLVFLWMIL